jgi:hypothetical protein
MFTLYTLATTDFPTRIVAPTALIFRMLVVSSSFGLVT